MALRLILLTTKAPRGAEMTTIGSGDDSTSAKEGIQSKSDKDSRKGNISSSRSEDDVDKVSRIVAEYSLSQKTLQLCHNRTCLLMDLLLLNLSLRRIFGLAVL